MTGWALDLGTTNSAVARWDEPLEKPRLVALPAICRKQGSTDPLEGDSELLRAFRQAIAEIQVRLPGASPGQLSLVGTEAGRLSLARDEPGQLSLAADPAGQLSLQATEGDARA
jgi:molecular chaperone DnaK (HSP70)